MKTKSTLFAIICLFLTCSLYSQNDKFWQLTWLKYQVARSVERFNINKFDWDQTVRNELEKSSNDYIENLESNNSFLYAPELADYLHHKLFEIYPEPFLSNRIAVIREIRVIKSSTPDIQVLNNGQILISTGMLSLIETEDELTALLAQQIAWFVLDLNYSTFKDHKRSELTSAILGVTAQIVTNVALNRKSYDYERNFILGAVAGDATQLISGSIFSSLSTKANKELEMKTDSVAKAYLIKKNINSEALCSLYSKLWEYGSMHPEYSTAGVLADFNRIPIRLKALEFKFNEKAIHLKDQKFDKIISESLNQNASILIGNYENDAAIANLDRVIDSDCAIEETYLYKAIALKTSQKSTDLDGFILELLDKAEQHVSNNSEAIDIERGLVYYRMNKKTLALDSFTNAKKKIETQANFSQEELIWVNKMIARCKLV
jgi:hypothetical protein